MDVDGDVPGDKREAPRDTDGRWGHKQAVGMPMWVGGDNFTVDTMKMVTSRRSMLGCGRARPTCSGLGTKMKTIALAVVWIAALGCAPTAAADVPGIAPFTGSWHAHASKLVINGEGSGRLTYADIAACPSACGGHVDFADAPPATVDFTLVSVVGDTATGSVDAASNPSEYTVRDPVTIKLITGIGDPFTGPPASVSGNNGVALQVSVGARGANYCNETTHNYCSG